MAAYDLQRSYSGLILLKVILLKRLFWDVDTQKDFIDEDGALYVEGAETIRDKLSALHDKLRLSSELLWGSVDYHSPDDPEIADNPDFEETFPPHCLRGTDGWERIVETAPIDPNYIGSTRRPESDMAKLGTIPEDELYFRKNEFDVFTNPNLKPTLDSLDPDRIIVFGVTLDVCVKFAVEGFLEENYDVAVIEDATRAIDESKREQLLSNWSERGARITSTDDVLNTLQ